MSTTQEYLKNLYINKSNNIIGISLGYKYINNQQTNIISVVYFVENKLPIEQVPTNEIIPDSLNINGTNYSTDVIETSIPESLSCYNAGDAEITRLQQETLPLKGGQGIVQFPTNFSSDGLSYIFSTLGLMCVDNIDNKFIGLTCAHSVLDSFEIAGNTNLSSQQTRPYSPYDQNLPLGENRGTLYKPSIILWDGVGNYGDKLISNNIKRYSNLLNGNVDPYTDLGIVNVWNTIDTALISFQETVPVGGNQILSIDSHKIYVPSNQTEYANVMDFATTEELNGLLTTHQPTYIYSTGRTTGPKGYNSNCRMQITNINQVMQTRITTGIGGAKFYPFSNIIGMRYVNTSYGAPGANGDSGSMVIAEYGDGTRKILGMVFAGSGQIIYFCRIDEIVNQLKIKKWDWISGPLDTSRLTPNPTFLKVNIGSVIGAILQNHQTTNINNKTYYQVGFTKSNVYPVYSG